MKREEEYNLFLQFFHPGVETFDKHAAKRRIETELSNVKRVVSFLRRCRCTPHILRAFIERHFDAACNSDDVEVRDFANDVIRAVNLLPKADQYAALRRVEDGFSPNVAALRKVCELLERKYRNEERRERHS